MSSRRKPTSQPRRQTPDPWRAIGSAPEHSRGRHHADPERTRTGATAETITRETARTCDRGAGDALRAKAEVDVELPTAPFHRRAAALSRPESALPVTGFGPQAVTKPSGSDIRARVDAGLRTPRGRALAEGLQTSPAPRRQSDRPGLPRMVDGSCFNVLRARWNPSREHQGRAATLEGEVPPCRQQRGREPRRPSRPCHRSSYPREAWLSSSATRSPWDTRSRRPRPPCRRRRLVLHAYCSRTAVGCFLRGAALWLRVLRWREGVA